MSRPAAKFYFLSEGFDWIDANGLQVPLIEELTAGPIPEGSCILVEYDPASQWYAASVTLATGWLMNGGTVSYTVAGQSPEKVQAQFRRLGVDVDAFEKDFKLKIHDWHTCTLGFRPTERPALGSLRIAELNIFFTENMLARPGGIISPFRDYLGILDDVSTLERFNDEKNWVEFVLTRYVPSAMLTKSVLFLGIIRGLHNKWVYRRLEAAADGIIDFKLQEISRETRNLLRIRSMRCAGYDSEWHELLIGNDLEVTFRKKPFRA